MGNVAIAFVESTISFSDYVAIKRQKRIEHKRIRQLIPRYLARLNNSDVSITTLNLNSLGVDIQILRLLSSPLLSGTTRVQSLYLEGNRIDVEGATCIARILSRDTNLVDVSLSHNPGKYLLGREHLLFIRYLFVIFNDMSTTPSLLTSSRLIYTLFEHALISYLLNLNR